MVTRVTRGGAAATTREARPSRQTRARLRRAAILTGFVTAFVLPLGVGRGDPNRGEGRSLIRDADRVYGTVAGEADASAVVQNPANMGLLTAVSGVVDVAWTRARAARRGSGIGGFVAIPIAKVVSLGVGLQWLDPRQREAITFDDAQLRFADSPYTKLNVAIAVPLERWVRGLSLGLGYGHAFSRSNFWADGVGHVDLAATWWPTRFVALGFVARGLNQPRVRADPFPDSTTASDRLSLVLDPELALRPLGDRRLEIGVGARLSPWRPSFNRFAEHVAQPRARLLLGFGGVTVYGEVERIAFHGADGTRDAARISAGLGFDFSHVGVHGGPLLGAGSGSAVEGGAGRIRLSAERYDSVIVGRPRVVTRVDVDRIAGDRGLVGAIATLDDIDGRYGEVALVDVSGAGLGWAQSEELREAMLRLRTRGGRVVTYLEGGSLKQYFLATASDHVVAHPRRSLEIVGLSLRTLYYGELLRSLGAKAEFVRVGEYKGAAEVWGAAHASPPVAQQRGQLLVDTWNHVVRTIAKDRGHDPLVVDGWIDAAPHRPERAIELGIVDAVAWPDELDAHLETWLGQKVRIVSKQKLARHRDEFADGPTVGILLVEGDLVRGRSVKIPILGLALAGSDTIVAAIRELRDDPRVKAVVVRLNTRGGSVVAAEEIGRALDLLDERKPVIVSMGNVAASGGYWIAASGRYVFADATTQTGSIGIFHPKVDLSGVLAKFGVGVDLETIGARAAMRSWFKPYDDDEEAAVLAELQASYDVFVERVAEARGMSTQEVEAVARGRVLTGARALEAGLVDRYGGVREAVLYARRAARLRPGSGPFAGDVRVVPAAPGLVEQIRSVLGLRLPNPLGVAGDGLAVNSVTDAPGDTGLDAAPDAGLANTHPAGTWGDPNAGLSPVVVPTWLRTALRGLPAGLWYQDAPEALAVATEQHEVE